METGGTAVKLDFSWISEAFNLLKGKLGEYVVMSLIAFLGNMAVSFLLRLPFEIGANVALSSDQPLLSLPFIFGNVISSIVATGISYVIYTGIIIYTLKLLRGENPRFEDLFAGFQNFGPYLLAGLLYGVTVSIATLLCILPGIVMAGLFMFVFPLIYDRKLPAFEAMTTSVNLLKDQWLMAAGYIFVAGLCSIAGILLCCVGIIATMPIMYIAQAIAYHRMVGGGSAYVQGASPYPRDPGTVANMPAGPESWPAQASDAPTPSASEEAPVIEDVPPVEDAEPTPSEDVPVVEDPPTDPEPPKA